MIPTIIVFSALFVLNLIIGVIAGCRYWAYKLESDREAASQAVASGCILGWALITVLGFMFYLPLGIAGWCLLILLLILGTIYSSM